MYELFADIPEACVNTEEISNKVEKYNINREAILPDFPLPENFTDEMFTLNI